MTNDDREWMIAQLGQMERRLDAKFEGMGRDFAEKLEGMETKLLTEFHKWASPMELRVKSHAMAMRALDLEIDGVKDRLVKLEPPSPAH